MKDNDSVVNRGSARIVKQYKVMRILNRKGSNSLHDSLLAKI